MAALKKVPGERGLYRNPSCGTYFVRIFHQGGDTYRSLDTTRISEARQRMDARRAAKAAARVVGKDAADPASALSVLGEGKGGGEEVFAGFLLAAAFLEFGPIEEGVHLTDAAVHKELDDAADLGGGVERKRRRRGGGSGEVPGEQMGQGEGGERWQKPEPGADGIQVHRSSADAGGAANSRREPGIALGSQASMIDGALMAEAR